jgi:hypothetical protein
MPFRLSLAGLALVLAASAGGPARAQITFPYDNNFSGGTAAPEAPLPESVPPPPADRDPAKAPQRSGHRRKPAGHPARQPANRAQPQ